MISKDNIQQIVTRQQSLETRGAYFKPIIDQEFANPSAYIKPYDQAK